MMRFKTKRLWRSAAAAVFLSAASAGPAASAQNAAAATWVQDGFEITNVESDCKWNGPASTVADIRDLYIGVGVFKALFKWNPDSGDTVNADVKSLRYTGSFDPLQNVIIKTRLSDMGQSLFDIAAHQCATHNRSAALLRRPKLG